MDEKKLNELIGNRKLMERKINLYLKRKVLTQQSVVKSEIRGHLEKARHNLNFVSSSFKNGFLDWTITGCYYALYHAVLSLISAKGYSSKNHDASLCILIKKYYKEISKEEIELVNNLFLSYNDLLFYVKSKEQREIASYSGQIIFDKNSVEDIISKTIDFVNKCKEILNEK